jgi:hypothetical protein
MLIKLYNLFVFFCVVVIICFLHICIYICCLEDFKLKNKMHIYLTIIASTTQKKKEERREREKKKYYNKD